MPIRKRRNGGGKAARTRYERDEIRLQNEGCGSVDAEIARLSLRSAYGARRAQSDGRPVKRRRESPRARASA
jgi:hypothetical protein